MGRGKLSMKPITNERSRMVTYNKRKKGLIKKVHEFRVLCDVDACAIIYGPKFNNRPIDVETIPSDHSEIKKIIDMYRSQGADRKKNQDLSHFFDARKKKMDDEIAKVHRACLEAKFPTWDNRLNSSKIQELYSLQSDLQYKIDLAMDRVLKLKGDSYLMIGEPSKSPELFQAGSSSNEYNTNINNSMACTFANALQQKPMELQQPLDHHHLMLPLNVNPPPLNNPTLMMMMKSNGGELSQFGSQAIDDQTVGNVEIPYPLSYGWQGSVTPNVSSHLQIPQFSDFCDFNELEMKNKKLQCLEYFKY